MSRKARIWISASAWLLAVASQCDALAAASTAPPDEDVARTTVHFDDLNLDQPSGVTSLYQRISVAAESVCGDRLLPGSRIIAPDWRRCTQQAVARAVAAVNRPALSAYYRARTRSPNQQPSIARR
jgi:UrcA family protein